MRWISSRTSATPQSLPTPGTVALRDKPDHVGHSHGLAVQDSTVDYSSDQAHFDVYLLEAGVIFHSVMIGVTLGATGGSEFVVLLVAIAYVTNSWTKSLLILRHSFHQFFEVSMRVLALVSSSPAVLGTRCRFSHWIVAVCQTWVLPQAVHGNLLWYNHASGHGNWNGRTWVRSQRSLLFISVHSLRRITLQHVQRKR